MTKRLSLLASLALAPVLAAAQVVVRLTVPAGQTWETFSVPRLPASEREGVVERPAGTHELERPSEGFLCAWDRESGNLAALPATKLPKEWRPKVADFRLVGRVGVRVEQGGRPLAGGRVVLRDAKGDSSQLLDPSSQGEAEFFGVSPGEVRVSVEYRSEGSTAPPVTQLFPLRLKRAEAEPVFEVALPGTAAEVPAGAKGEGEAKGRPTRQGSFLGSLLVYLLTLAGVLGLGYWALQYVKRNPDPVKQRLAQLGVDVPEPPAADEPAPPAPRAHQPQEKILLDPPVATAGVGEPRLVKASGEFVVLEEGESMVGRDSGLAISLAGESTVSRRHAALVRRGGSVSVRDLGSTNGTFVNGRRIDAERALRPGDEVQFGSVRFRVEAP